jgi:hypothetical protein
MLVRLDDPEVALIQEILDAEERDLHHEIHYTDSNQYKESLKAKLELVQAVRRKLANPAQGT